MAELSRQDIKILEQTRDLLSRLTNSLESLRVLLLGPVPRGASIQSSASIISLNLESFSRHLSKHFSFFDTLSVFPSSNFPGKTQELVLGMLLRKKLEPGAADWLAEGKESANHASGTEGERREMLELWHQAGPVANYFAKAQAWGVNYTVEEMESGPKEVVTGLKRKWSEVEDVEDGVQILEVKEDSLTQPLPLEQMLRFMTRGSKPEALR